MARRVEDYGLTLLKRVNGYIVEHLGTAYSCAVFPHIGDHNGIKKTQDMAENSVGKVCLIHKRLQSYVPERAQHDERVNHGSVGRQHKLHAILVHKLTPLNADIVVERENLLKQMAHYLPAIEEDIHARK